MPVRELKLMRRSRPEAHAERSIRKTALALLQIVDHFESKALPRGPGNRIAVADAAELDRSAVRSVGLPYDEVMRRLKAEFPKAITSIACLRWYGVKVREGVFGEGITLPQRRPRAVRPRALTSPSTGVTRAGLNPSPDAL